MFEKIKKAFEASPEHQEITFRVEGAHKYAKQIETLAIPMKKWDMSNEELAKKYTLKKIYKYYFEKTSAKLIPEKNGYKVMIKNKHVGYVPQRDIVEIRKILIHKVDRSAEIKGGEYKVVSANGDAVVMDDRYSIEVTISRG